MRNVSATATSIPPEEVTPGGTPRTPAPRTPAPRTPSGAHYLTRVVIFEFDQALIATDVPAFFEDATAVARDRALNIFGGMQRVQMLAGFLTELTTVHSCRLAICSSLNRDGRSCLPLRPGNHRRDRCCRRRWTL